VIQKELKVFKKKLSLYSRHGTLGAPGDGNANNNRHQNLAKGIRVTVESGV